MLLINAPLNTLITLSTSYRLLTPSLTLFTFIPLQLLIKPMYSILFTFITLLFTFITPLFIFSSGAPPLDYSASTWLGPHPIRGGFSNHHLAGTAGGGSQVAIAWRHELIDASIVRHLKIAARVPFHLHGSTSSSTVHPKEMKSKALPLDTLFQQVKEALQEQSNVTVRRSRYVLLSVAYLSVGLFFICSFLV